MRKELAIATMLAFMCSSPSVYSGPGNKISDLSAKLQYALYLLNDESAKIIRQFLLIPDSQVMTGCPVRFYQGRYYRVYLLSYDDEDDDFGFLCDDIQVLPSQSLPANTPLVTPANTPVSDPAENPFFPADDSNAIRIPAVKCTARAIKGQKLTPDALRRLDRKMRIALNESIRGATGSTHHIEQRTDDNTMTLNPDDRRDALFFYLKKRLNMNANQIFFTHNKDSESNIIMVIRRSFEVPRSTHTRGFEPGMSYACLEISIPVGTFEFSPLHQLLSMSHEYTSCTDAWQSLVTGYGVPKETNPDMESELSEFSDIALFDCLQELELNWNSANPIDNPMVERVLGTGISSVVVSLFHPFRSLAFKRLYMSCDEKEKARDVIRSARINLLLLHIYGIPVAPMQYVVVYNQKQDHYAIYCIQALYSPEQFADHFLENPGVPTEEKMKLINTIIYYMNLCDIYNGFQQGADAGFKGYFRAAIDSNYPNYCLINGIWHLIDLSPFFWSVGDHFSEANQHILDMSQSEDYYSFIRSLCTNPTQLYVFFCGRMYRPYQKYNRSPLPDDQRKSGEWLGLYHYALRRVSTLPQINREFDQSQWRQVDPYDEGSREAFWRILLSQRNADPSQAYLDGVIELVSMNREAGHPVILDGTATSWQQPPAAYHQFLKNENLIDAVDFLSATAAERRGKHQTDIPEAARQLRGQTPEALLELISATPEEQANRDQFLEYLRVQTILKQLSQNMAEDNNQRAANRRRLLKAQRASNPPPPPEIYTTLTAMNDAEMADFLHIQFNAEYLPVESDGNCLWNAIAKALLKKGIIIAPDNLMQAVLQSHHHHQAQFPSYQQNWGDTDFIPGILHHLAAQDVHLGIVVLQPHGTGMVGVWYGMADGELVTHPLGNNPFHLQQAINDPGNITLVNHQNGNDGDFQVNHWGAAAPLPDTTRGEDIEQSSPATARSGILPPHLFEHQFYSMTGLTLLPALSPLQLTSPKPPQPLTNYRNLLLSLISNYLLICNKDMAGCLHQLNGMLSLLPADQKVNAQNLQNGHIEPFLHILAALLHWMNPQPVNQKQRDAALQHPESLTQITVICPFIGGTGLPSYAAWHLTLTQNSRGYIHIKRTFIKHIDLLRENFRNKQHLHLVTNIPVTPLGHLAWPYHQPDLAQWWVVSPQAHSVWMLGTLLDQHVSQPHNTSPGTDPEDYEKQLSDEVSQLNMARFSPEKPEGSDHPSATETRRVPKSPPAKPFSRYNNDEDGKPPPDSSPGEVSGTRERIAHNPDEHSVGQNILHDWQVPPTHLPGLAGALLPLLLYGKHGR